MSRDRDPFCAICSRGEHSMTCRSCGDPCGWCADDSFFGYGACCKACTHAWDCVAGGKVEPVRIIAVGAVKSSSEWP